MKLDVGTEFSRCRVLGICPRDERRSRRIRQDNPGGLWATFYSIFKDLAGWAVAEAICKFKPIFEHSAKRSQLMLSPYRSVCYVVTLQKLLSKSVLFTSPPGLKRKPVTRSPAVQKTGALHARYRSDGRQLVLTWDAAVLADLSSVISSKKFVEDVYA